MTQAINSADGQILLMIQDMLRNPVLDKFFVGFTKLGDHGMLFIAMALLLLIIPVLRKKGYAATLGLTIGFLITVVLLKPFFKRPRPYLTVSGLRALVDMSSDPNSFPSGHTTAAFGVCVVLFLTVKDVRVKSAALFLAVLMGFSRLYVGVHNPTDVLAGALIGTFGAFMGVVIVKAADRYLERKRQHGEEQQ